VFEWDNPLLLARFGKCADYIIQSQVRHRLVKNPMSYFSRRARMRYDSPEMSLSRSTGVPDLLGL
jgi:hypothetical protein